MPPLLLHWLFSVRHSGFAWFAIDPITGIKDHTMTLTKYFFLFLSSGRGDRMKQAKVEAQVLIDGYRAEKQEEFNNMVLSKGGTEGNASAKLQAETTKEIKDMEASFSKNSAQAVDLLLSKCCEVSLEVPTARVRSTQKAAGITA